MWIFYCRTGYLDWVDDKIWFFYLYLFTCFKICHLKSEEIRLCSKLEGGKLSATFVLNKTVREPKETRIEISVPNSFKIPNFKSFRGFLLPFILWWDDQCKVIHPKYTMNTWLMFWNCKWDWECGKMIDHGSNHGFIHCTHLVFEWKCILNSIKNFRLKIYRLFHLNINKQPFHMRYHLFLQYGWFLQNLGKDFIWTNMHTTVAL